MELDDVSAVAEQAAVIDDPELNREARRSLRRLPSPAMKSDAAVSAGDATRECLQEDVEALCRSNRPTAPMAMSPSSRPSFARAGARPASFLWLAGSMEQDDGNSIGGSISHERPAYLV